MRMPELSVCLENLHSGVRAALDLARTLGFHVVDAGATGGPISPGELSRSGQRHLLRHLADANLRLGSLRGPTDGDRYGDPGGGERRLDTMRKIVALASSLKVPVVSTTLGRSNAATGDERDATREALEILADDADRAGVIVAVETSGISAEELRTILECIDCPNLASCCDTGAAIITGEDPSAAADFLVGRLKLVRLRDAVAPTANAEGHEVALGEGLLDVPRFLASIADGGYHGEMVVMRTTGKNRVADVSKAKILLDEALGRRHS